MDELGRERLSYHAQIETKPPLKAIPPSTNVEVQEAKLEIVPATPE